MQSMNVNMDYAMWWIWLPGCWWCDQGEIP